MLLSEIADVSAQVASVSGRRAKIEQMASLLGRARADEVPIAVAFLSGELRQRQIGVGYAALSDLLAPLRETAAAAGTTADPPDPAGTATAAGAAPDPASAAAAAEPTLTLADADSAFAAIGEISGSGAQAQRRSLLAALFGRATEAERTFLIQLLAGDLRQGALEGVMVEAVAQAAAVPAGEVRRALMLGGSLPAVAQAALSGLAADGEAALTALRSFSLAVGRPLRPMLAASAATIADAMAKISPAAIEWKIDGIRVQVHKDGPRIAVFTRTLDDITARVPEIVEAVAALPAATAVLDGEVIALSPNGRPQPFQVTAGRAGSRAEVEARREDVPLSVFFFDLLHLDGTDLIDLPARARYARLAGLLPAGLLIPRTVSADADAAEAFFADAVSQGHEGVVVKSLDAPYAAGRRGGEWIKVKPRHTLDLVVLAAEWGHGRRRGWLSNLHLGARDTDGDGFVMLGKTFKGLTDQMLAWQTGRLLELAADGPGQARMPEDAGGVVRVRPGLVAEIAFDGVQTSRRYPGGLALRFARVIRYRLDKQAADADTIDAVRAIAGKIEEE